MSASTRRLWGLYAIYGAALATVGAHLLVVMGAQHDDWLVRSYRNRWTFRDVPSVRGALLDRHGRVLAHDEPTFELECVYERFRLLHPIGAAIHGASQASRLFANEVRYAFVGTAVGPEAALRDLLALPVGTLLRAPLAKQERRELLYSVTTVLAAACERERSRVIKDLRRAADASPEQPVGAVMPDLDADAVLTGALGVLTRLRAIDAALQTAVAGPERDADAASAVEASSARGDGAATVAAAAAPARSLLERLDGFRIDSLEQRRTRFRSDDGAWHEGELLDRLARPIAVELPFALAAALRLAQADQPGLRLEPALVRRRAADLPPTLRQILGDVQALDRSEDLQDYVDRRVADDLAGELDEFVPDDLLPLPEYRQELVAAAQRNYERVLRTRERRGTGGVEIVLDRVLAGAPGMRLVERDARSKEQVLWSSLRVEPGTDVRLSVDLDLQALVDAQCAAALAHWRVAAPDPRPIDVAMAIVDASSGDVLALGGAPTAIDDLPRLPAVLSWRGNGALGSIVKPFALAEQLRAMRHGRPCADLEHLDACPQKWRGPDRRLYRCDHAHWDEGKDPVTALAKSCNVFFYQVALGLGDDGLRRAYWQFGLHPDLDGGEARFCERPAELPRALCAAPRWSGQQALPMRGIGYGIEANPVAVATAYAALATGRLPTAGLRAGAARPPHGIDLADGELALIRAGLQECVEHGTAKGIAGLAAFAVLGKTGTAEISAGGANNAWFAGYLPVVAADGVQLAFCAVVYAVPDGTHGADAAGQLVADVLAAMAQTPALGSRYLQPGSGR